MVFNVRAHTGCELAVQREWTRRPRGPLPESLRERRPPQSVRRPVRPANLKGYPQVCQGRRALRGSTYAPRSSCSLRCSWVRQQVFSPSSPITSAPSQCWRAAEGLQAQPSSSTGSSRADSPEALTAQTPAPDMPPSGALGMRPGEMSSKPPAAGPQPPGWPGDHQHRRPLAPLWPCTRRQ